MTSLPAAVLKPLKPDHRFIGGSDESRTIYCRDIFKSGIIESPWQQAPDTASMAK